jgi:hypothetical protein
MFRSMYDGSLATRGPWQALVTFQQMLVLADRFGIVDMTAEAISRTTTLPLDVIEEGLQVLSKPDPDSRRPDHDGCRIVPIAPNRNWGWQIVNYEHYKQIRSAEERREYQRQYMQQYRSAGFDEFWKVYPRKRAKGDAERAWKRLHPDESLRAAILEAVAKQLQSDDWRRENGQYIPYPASWLNSRRWEDGTEQSADRGYVGPG